MTSIFHIVRQATRAYSKSTLFSFRAASSTSDKCGSSGGKKCSDGVGGKENKQLLLAPCPEDSNNPSAPTIYDSRKLGHNSPTNEVDPSFETLQKIPTGVFRCTTGEILGRGAGKCCYYQNPEYFSFHHMSFYDLNSGLRQYREPSPKSGRKPN